MSDFIVQYYLYIKAFHVIAVMSWMAGLLYLPRLYVYHARAEKGSISSETFKIMEAKLLRVIMNPAMILSWILGILMIAGNPDVFSHGWMHVKFLCIILMTITHMVYAKWRKIFAADGNVRDHKFYRWWNEAPTILMIVIVIMAVAEPF